MKNGSTHKPANSELNRPRGVILSVAQAHNARNVLVFGSFARCDYPPDLQEAAVQTVLQQAELLCADLTADDNREAPGTSQSGGAR